MQFRTRDHVRGLTAVLSVASLALVFGVALGAVPGSALPRAPDGVVSAIPHVNAVISTVAIVTILAGVRFVRRGEVRRHRATMLISLGLFGAFLALYLYKVALEGPAAFPGPADVYRFVYLPMLAVHVLLAVVCLPLLYFVALVGLTHPVEEVYRSAHRRVGRVAATLWVVSFALGDAVYGLLYVVY
ncbi:MAG: DUF420 domain-containing protein [Salinigranum sp.]